uniref:Uncharacterized protein n=1 Tax=Knipowitschia caucasica TaxID=637954 RepID=A0AAV2M0D7_KNICA
MHSVEHPQSLYTQAMTMQPPSANQPLSLPSPRSNASASPSLLAPLHPSPSLSCFTGVMLLELQQREITQGFYCLNTTRLSWPHRCR